MGGSWGVMRRISTSIRESRAQGEPEGEEGRGEGGGEREREAVAPATPSPVLFAEGETEAHREVIWEAHTSGD